MKAHSLAVYGLAFAPGGKQLATCSGDFEKGSSGEVKLWDAASAKEIRTLRGFVREVWCVAFSPSGRYLAVGASRPANRKWPTVRVWEVATGDEAANFELGPYVRCVAFSRDEKTLTAGAGDGTIGSWDVNGWKEKSSWRAGTEPLFSLVFGESTGSLIAASKDGTATFWQLAQPPKSVADAKEAD